jgi:hypothetical protein
MVPNVRSQHRHYIFPMGFQSNNLDLRAQYLS